MPSIYHVNIAQITGTANSAGFVDNTKIENYTTEPQAKSDALNKERANIRFIKIVDGLQVMGNMDLVNVVATGANATTAPTAFEFDLSVDKGDSILFTKDETTGAEITGAAAIKRVIARALALEHTKISEIRTNTKQFFIVEPLTIGSLGNVATIETSITVTKTF
jgi:U3 small nucleolar RNA-associated protein 14